MISPLRLLRVWTIGCLVLASTGCHDDPLIVMSYNVQNLFDATYQGTEYAEFDPRHGEYTSREYQSRLGDLGRLLAELRPEPPDILVLQEVENLSVVHDLVEAAGWSHGLSTRIFDPAPVGGIGVAVATGLSVAAVRAHRPVYLLSPGRTILEVHLRAESGRIILFANHWKSRRGGVEATRPHRWVAQRAIAYRLAATEADLVLVVGDLNSEAMEKDRGLAGLPPPGLRLRMSSSTAQGNSSRTREGHTIVLQQPWYAAVQPGSYAYRGDWQRLDHILYVTPAVSPRFALRDFWAPATPESLTADGYPRRWIPRVGGFSDHLPVMARFDQRPPLRLE